MRKANFEPRTSENSDASSEFVLLTVASDSLMGAT